MVATGEVAPGVTAGTTGIQTLGAGGVDPPLAGAWQLLPVLR